MPWLFGFIPILLDLLIPWPRPAGSCIVLYTPSPPGLLGPLRAGLDPTRIAEAGTPAALSLVIESPNGEKFGINQAALPPAIWLG